MHAREFLDELARLGNPEVVKIPFHVQTDRQFSKEDYENRAVEILQAMQPSVAEVQWNVSRVVSVEEIKDFFYFLEEAQIYTSEIDITHPGSRVSLASIEQAIEELKDDAIEVSLVGEVHRLSKSAEEVLQELSAMPEDGVATIPLLVQFSDELKAMQPEQYEREVALRLIAKSPSKIIFSWNADGEVDVEDIRSWLLIGKAAMASNAELDISYVGADENILAITEAVEEINYESHELSYHVDIVMLAESILDLASQPENGVVLLPHGVRFSDEEGALREDTFKIRLARILRKNQVSKVIIHSITQENLTGDMLRGSVSNLIEGGVYDIQFDTGYLLSDSTKNVLNMMISVFSTIYKMPYKFCLCLVNPPIKSVMKKLMSEVAGFGDEADCQEDNDDDSSENSNETKRVNVYELRLSHLFPNQYSNILCEQLMRQFRAMLAEKDMQFLEIIWDIKFQLSEEKIRFLIENCGVDSIDINLRRAGSRYSVKNILAAVEGLHKDMPGEFSIDVLMAHHSARFFKEHYTLRRPQKKKEIVKKPASKLRLSKTSDDSDKSDDEISIHRVDSEPVMLMHSTDSGMRAPAKSRRAAH